MTRLWVSACILCLAAIPAAGRRAGGAECGTTAETAAEASFLHRRAQAARAMHPRLLSAGPAVAGNRDIGQVAIIEGANGAVETLNEFNLDLSTVTFTPVTGAAAGGASGTATRYRYAYSGLGYDANAATRGTPLIALGDDDARALTLPFPFRFYGTTYRQVYLNSDGNLTFTAAEYASTGRTVGRVTGGPPRIAPLFDDLDPSQAGAAVTYFSDPNQAVFSWVNVPEFTLYGTGTPQTFQVRLYADGSIQFSYSGAAPLSAVVGLAPGSVQGTTTLVDFRTETSAEYTAAVVERFGNTVDIDIVSVAQQFYRTHEDAYDYLVIYNSMDIDAGLGAVAYESTVRSNAAGYGVAVQDSGQQYGSGARLRSVLNLGRLTNYPLDGSALVPLRAAQGDTPLTILGHEAGHLFLAFASIPDADGASTKPMLGFQGSHWSFLYDSEASLLEGEKITDYGANAAPRFLTTAITQGYSPLDRYLMGFAPASDVPDTFLVTGASQPAAQHQQLGVGFYGTRVNVNVNALVQEMGRRTPDSTVAQRRFRFAFILVVPPGAGDAAISGSVQQVESYRQQFPAAYAKFSGNLASVETTLNRSLRLSLFPAAGVVAGASASGTVAVATAPVADLGIRLSAANGYAQAPAQLTIAAGTKTAAFTVTGLKNGVEELQAIPADPAYETAFARVQVAGGPQVAGAAQLTLRALSGEGQMASGGAPLAAPVVVQLTDGNGLVYPGARIAAAASAGGTVTPLVVAADANGQASFQWTPGAGGVNQLKLSVEAAPGVAVTVSAGSAVPVIGAVTNAASGSVGVSVGALETIYGVNLSGAAVQVNGAAASLLYGSDTQINFLMPAVAAGAGTVTVIAPSGQRASAAVNVAAAQPGIFKGAVLHAGTAVSASTVAVSAGEFLEIYCTGLGATQTGVNGLAVARAAPVVYFGTVRATPVYSGAAPGFPGLYQVNVQVPAGLSGGTVALAIVSDGVSSNLVEIKVQ